MSRPSPGKWEQQSDGGQGWVALVARVSCHAGPEPPVGVAGQGDERRAEGPHFLPTQPGPRLPQARHCSAPRASHLQMGPWENSSPWGSRLAPGPPPCLCLSRGPLPCFPGRCPGSVLGLGTGTLQSGLACPSQIPRLPWASCGHSLLLELGPCLGSPSHRRPPSPLELHTRVVCLCFYFLS